MKFAASGSKLFINSSGWVQITGVETLSGLGGEWVMIDQQVICETNEVPMVEFMKQSLRPSAMSLTLALDPTDAGQIALHAAFAAFDATPAFKITFPGGTSREWTAYVTAFTDDLNSADDMARVNVTLQLTGLITRSEDT